MPSPTKSRGSFQFFALLVLIAAAMTEVEAFSVVSKSSARPRLAKPSQPCSSSFQSTTRISTRLAAANNKKKTSPETTTAKYQVDDPTEIFGPLRFIVPLLFVGQICFLAVAKQTSGLENLTLYGELGNAYIRSNGGYDPSKSLLERQGITSMGQKIWFNNVIRDIQNGGPVKPPLTEP